jgi:cell division protein FtsB
MLCVMAAIVYLYLSAGVTLFSTWRQSKTDSAQAAALERQNRILVHQHDALAAQGAIQAEARRLGMIRPGEQSYVVSGLPAN